MSAQLKLNEWTDDQETVLEKIRENCLEKKRSTTKSYISYKEQLSRYKIPIIVLSAMNSVFSVGTQDYFPQNVISGITCLISLLVGIIGSVQLYLQIEANMENCLVASKDYYNLAIDIYKNLTLTRDHRSMSGKEYLDDIYNRYVSITEKTVLTSSKKYNDALFEVPGLPDNFKLRYSIDETLHIDTTEPPSPSPVTQHPRKSIKPNSLELQQFQQLQVPQLQVPQLQVPQLQVPQLQVPQLQVPQLQVPQLQVPQVPQVPQLQVEIPQKTELLSKLDESVVVADIPSFKLKFGGN
jgi:hypothetical protein